MKILLTDIGSERRRYRIEESIHFSGTDLEQSVPVEAEITVKRFNKNLFVVTGSLQARVTLPCNRCSTGVDCEVAEDFVYTFRLDDEPQISKEYGCSDEDCETVYLDEPFIESDMILKEQIFLALPTHCLCDEMCRGLCDGCGVNLNNNACQCIEDNSGSPFAVLKK